MNEDAEAPAKTGAMSEKTRRYVKLFVDYAGLVAFLAAIWITGDAVKASWAVVAGSIAALVVGFIVERRLAVIPLATAVFGVIAGGLTLYFHDDRIIKMKLTFLDTGIGLALLIALARGKNPIKALIGDELKLPDPIARTLTIRYALLFLAMAAANEVIWRTQSTRVWALYKFPGTAILIFGFFLTQFPLMMKHVPPDEPKA